MPAPHRTSLVASAQSLVYGPHFNLETPPVSPSPLDSGLGQVPAPARVSPGPGERQSVSVSGPRCFTAWPRGAGLTDLCEVTVTPPGTPREKGAPPGQGTGDPHPADRAPPALEAPLPCRRFPGPGLESGEGGPAPLPLHEVSCRDLAEV